MSRDMALIVIAEDEFLVANVLAMMLEDAGFEVASAPNGKVALELIRDQRPALVITDFMMPLMTGLELAREIRADGELAATPIILVSGAQGNIGRAQPEMFDAVLDKPFNEAKLVATVAGVLAKVGAAKEEG